MQVHILSGDSLASVAKLGESLRLPPSALHAEFTALDKLEWVRNQQSVGNNSVIMVGDGTD
jgi:cation transport ATPase